jgi:hypothetical protein
LNFWVLFGREVFQWHEQSLMMNLFRLQPGFPRNWSKKSTGSSRSSKWKSFSPEGEAKLRPALILSNHHYNKTRYEVIISAIISNQEHFKVSLLFIIAKP